MFFRLGNVIFLNSKNLYSVGYDTHSQLIITGDFNSDDLLIIAMLLIMEQMMLKYFYRLISFVSNILIDTYKFRLIKTNSCAIMI